MQNNLFEIIDKLNNFRSCMVAMNYIHEAIHFMASKEGFLTKDEDIQSGMVSIRDKLVEEYEKILDFADEIYKKTLTKEELQKIEEIKNLAEQNKGEE